MTCCMMNDDVIQKIKKELIVRTINEGYLKRRIKYIKIIKNDVIKNYLKIIIK